MSEKVKVSLLKAAHTSPTIAMTIGLVVYFLSLEEQGNWPIEASTTLLLLLCHLLQAVSHSEKWPTYSIALSLTGVLSDRQAVE